MVAVADILRRDSFFLGAYGDGHSVLVATADEDHILLLQTKVADIDVCRYIYTGQMADMDGAVRIRQCRCDGSSFKVLFQ